MEKAVAVYPSPHFSFKGFLFSQDEQILRQPSDEKIWFYLIEDQKVIGLFVLHIKDDKAQSPFRAPFGSFELSEKVDYSVLDRWIKEVVKVSLERNLKSIHIVSYPFCYDPLHSPVLTAALVANNFRIKHTDLNYHLDISSDFEQTLHVSEKRRLKKSEKEGFSFQLMGADKLEAVHDLIKRCRERRGFPLSMGREEFIQLISKNSSDYLVFGLSDKDRLIAVSVGVRVNDHILYDFLPADEEDYKSFSPMVLLKKEIVSFCKDKNFKIFDLGIATADGVPNMGLIRFKENLGGIPSLKLTFELTL